MKTSSTQMQAQIFSSNSSAQEIFDRIVNHLRAQACKSILKISSGSTDCRYRGPNNTSCAVGCIIPDNEYLLDMEGEDVDNLLKRGLLKDDTRNVVSKHKELLSALQNIHDSWNVAEWESEFEKLAEEQGLTYKTS